MKKQLLLFASIFFINTAFSQSYQDALNKLNTYLETYNGGYYGPIEVRDGSLYIAEGGKNSFSYAKLEKITRAFIENKDLVIQCVNNENCFYNTYRNSYSPKMYFSTSPKSESLNLLPLINNFLNSYDKEIGFTRESGNLKVKDNVPNNKMSIPKSEDDLAKNTSKNKKIKEETAPQKEITTTGCVSGNCKNGFGKFVYDNGTYYEGDFKKGKYQGKGTRILLNGEKLTGDFKDGQQIGTGKIIFVNGKIWEGMCYAGNPDGLGKMIYLNGNQFMGIMNKWHQRNGEGTYTLKNGYTKKGTFVEGTMNTNGKIEKLEYFNAENQKITKEIFDQEENSLIVIADELLKQKQQVKLQQFMQKNKGVIVQNITIPFKDVTDLSDMSYRSADIDIVFSNTTAGLFCIKRKENRPSSYDTYQDEITAFSINNHKRVLSGYVERLRLNDIGRDIAEEFTKKESKSNTFKLNYADKTVKQILEDLNYLNAPEGSVAFDAANADYYIFRGPFLGVKSNTGGATYFFINRKSNLCEKIINVNTPSDMVWNEDFTKSSIKQMHKLQENLVPDVYREAYYYSIIYIIDWETQEAKHLDDHISQLNYLAEAINIKITGDAEREASRPERERQSRKDWEDYNESQRIINANVEKSKALTPKTAKERFYYYNSVGNKVYTD